MRNVVDYLLISQQVCQLWGFCEISIITRSHLSTLRGEVAT